MQAAQKNNTEEFTINITFPNAKESREMVRLQHLVEEAAKEVGGSTWSVGVQGFSQHERRRLEVAIPVGRFVAFQQSMQHTLRHAYTFDVASVPDTVVQIKPVGGAPAVS
jgi:hypothetical protein